MENLKLWWHNEKFNIILTLFAGIFPLVIGWCIQYEDLIHENKDHLLFEIGPLMNYILQSIFILITLFVLIKNRAKTQKELSESEGQIKQYIAKNCNIKMFNDKTLNETYEVVDGTIKQFYGAWLVVWLLWLIYYIGNFILELSKASESQIIFSRIFDFLSSSVIFVVYFILNNVTVNRQRRLKSDNGFWYSTLAWVCIFTLWLVGVCIEATSPTYSTIYKNSEYLVSLLLSIFSAVSFVLVLGKINSNYLQIPRVFMFGLYVYAIIQAYVPFQNYPELGFASKILQLAIPYVTLTGKIFVMLTLCWIVNQKRFIFFVIHKSVSIEETPVLLNELNKEHVSF